MSALKILGFLLLLSAPIAGFVLQTHWNLLATQQPAQIVSQSTATQIDGTIVHTTVLAVQEAKVRWSLVLLLVVVFVTGVICVYIARERTSI